MHQQAWLPELIFTLTAHMAWICSSVCYSQMWGNHLIPPTTVCVYNVCAQEAFSADCNHSWFKPLQAILLQEATQLLPVLLTQWWQTPGRGWPPGYHHQATTQLERWKRKTGFISGGVGHARSDVWPESGPWSLCLESMWACTAFEWPSRCLK